MKETNQANSNDNFEQILATLSKNDFDGHTSFKKLSADKKLFWLSKSSQFFFKYSRSLRNKQKLS